MPDLAACCRIVPDLKLPLALHYAVMDTKSIERARRIGWAIARHYHLDPDDCSQEAVAVALEVFRDAGVESSAGSTLWDRVHARLVARRGALRYTFPVGCDGPKRECKDCDSEIGGGQQGGRCCRPVSLGSAEADRVATLRRLGVRA